MNNKRRGCRTPRRLCFRPPSITGPSALPWSARSRTRGRSEEGTSLTPLFCCPRLTAAGAESPRGSRLPDAAGGRVESSQPAAAGAVGVDADEEAQVEDLPRLLRRVSHH